MMCYVFFFKQKTAYEMRISDWSSDVCSSDLGMMNSPRPMRIAMPATGSHGVPAIDAATNTVPQTGGVMVHSSAYQNTNIWACSSGRPSLTRDRKSVVSGKRVSVLVDLGGRRIIKKKNNCNNPYYQTDS